ncbi:MAG TPA: bifunctional DNA primase/polymerase [Alphaproteobacteria bacterium]|nr:bifunctional DNA primase/polymerase [Alphaproteobacteria bacterium]
MTLEFDRTDPTHRFWYLGRRLLQNGYSVVPILQGEKSPSITGWSGDFDEELWFCCGYWDRYTGIRTGFKNVVALDIDTLDEKVAEAVEKAAVEIFGPTPLVRIGRWPKRILVYRSDGTIPNKVAYKDREGKVVFEILTKGQQFLAFAIHPGTRKPYRWVDKSPLDVPSSALPVITDDLLKRFTQEVERLIPRGGHQSVLGSRPAPSSVTSPEDSTGKKLDGRNDDGTRIRFAIYKDLLARHGKVDLDLFARTSWERFKSECAIEATPYSSNTYTDEGWFRTCMQDAARLESKFKTSPGTFAGIPPWFSNDLVDPEAAQEILTKHVQGFFAEPAHTVIRITAGTGKTTTVARELARAIGSGRKVAHWYTPRIALALDVRDEILKWDPTLRVVVIRGRSEENCSAVNAAIEKHLPVGKIVCGDSHDVRAEGQAGLPLAREAGRCPHFDECPYQAQYAAARDANIVIMAHAQLRRRKDRRIPAADFIIIDESFFDELLEIEEIPVSEIEHNELGWLLLSALKQRDVPPRDYLERRGVTADRARSAARGLYAVHKALVEKLCEFTATDRLTDQIGAVRPVPRLATVLNALADELESDRVSLLSFELRSEGKQGRLVVRRRTRPRALKKPALILDATADKRLLELIIAKKFAFHDIAVRRSGRIVQTSNVLMDATSLNGPRGSVYIDKVRRLIHQLDETGRKGVIFSYLKLKELLRAPEGWKTDHFGNLRGTNDYKDETTAVIVGRWQLPPSAIADKVAALLSGTDLEPDMSGKRSKELRGYRMRDGSLVGKSVDVYEDPIWQAVDEQTREAELEQAIDRLRLVWSGRGKQIYVLTSLVGRFEVDEVVILDELAGCTKFDLAHDKIGPVVPMGARWLSENLPNIFGKERAVRAAVREEWSKLEGQRTERVQNSYMNIPITNSAPFPSSKVSEAKLIPYRVAGQRGSNTCAHVLPGTPLEVIVAELERLHGKAVELKLGENIALFESQSPAEPEAPKLKRVI